MKFLVYLSTFLQLLLISKFSKAFTLMSKKILRQFQTKKKSIISTTASNTKQNQNKKKSQNRQIENKEINKFRDTRIEDTTK